MSVFGGKAAVFRVSLESPVLTLAYCFNHWVIEFEKSRAKNRVKNWYIKMGPDRTLYRKRIVT